MKIFEKIGKALGDAASFVEEKNRRKACLNRIRMVIRCEEAAAQREYQALGRYYYNNLRDPENTVTEPHCAELEAIDARLERALSQLEQFYCQKTEECSCRCCGDGEEIDLQDVEEFDQDPALLETQEAKEPEAPASVPGAQPAGEDENDSLPFEG